MSEAAGNHADANAPGLADGTRVGRYVLLERIGAGGMGTVYAAYDPELDRKIAIKVIHVADAPIDLLDEARALAKLSHAHVVAVHDVGTCGDDPPLTFVAMELVEGRTLSAWLAEHERSQPEILDVLVQAGRGLAAAHAVGIVHRDFKPDNVLVDRSDHARVVDFGLARVADIESAHSTDAHTSTSDDATPMYGGTPAYMSPEQIAGLPVDARSDQYSFCVALWEALYRQRPFVGTSLVDLASKILEARRRPAPRGIRVPRWLRAALDRGLGLDPGDRWPTLDALLDAIERGRRRARRIAAFAGVGVLVGAGAVVLGLRHLHEQRRVAACEAAGEAIAAVWNGQTRAAVQDALIATGASYAESTAQRVTPWLDAHADAWADARTHTCLDARQDRDAETVERSTWCLEDRRLELAALVDALREPDLAALRTAVQAASSLRRIEPCRDPTFLAAAPAPPIEARDEVQAIREQLAVVRALQTTAAYDEGIALAEQTLKRAEEVGWAPLSAAARSELGNLLVRTGKDAQAEAMLEAAFFEAARVDANEDAFIAANDLAFVVGSRLARPVEAERWVRLGDVERAQLPDPIGLREARSLTSLALLRMNGGRYDEAESLYLRSLALRENALPPDHPMITAVLERLGQVYAIEGELEKAAELQTRALAARERALGPDHPDLAIALDSLADVRAQVGALEEASELQARAIRNWEAVFGREHPDLAAFLNNAASVQIELGAFEDAEQSFRRALAIWEKAYGATHPKVAVALSNLAMVRETRHAYDEAEALLRRAIAIHEQATPAEHPDLAYALHNLAVVRIVQGDLDEAQQLETEAMRLREQAHGSEHPLLLGPLVGLARVAMARGQPAEAVTLGERALQIAASSETVARDAADARFVLARALVATAQSPARARQLAEEARLRYAEEGAGGREALAEVDAWLRAR
jgi:tetratricopeptide (TPR) repeat protein